MASPHVTTRRELIWLLTAAAELEHSLAVQYLFTAFSLKQPGDPGLSESTASLVSTWARLIYKIATQEMLHLCLACNLLTAVGGAPNLRRPNFPQPSTTYSLGLPSTLAPFNLDTISRYICWEKPATRGWWDDLCPRSSDLVPLEIATLRSLNKDEPQYRSVEELYTLIADGFTDVPDVIIGAPAAQLTNAYIPFVPPLIPVVDVRSACAAVDLIIREGEGLPNDPSANCHFAYFAQIWKELQEQLAANPTFQPAWPVIENPLYDFHNDITLAGTHVVTHPLARQAGKLFTITYDLMLQMLMRVFYQAGETPDELKLLATLATELMTGVIRPLGVLLTRLPVGDLPNRTAGPSFELYQSTQVLPHRESAWRAFHESVMALSAGCQNLAQHPDLPPNLLNSVIWAGMVLHTMAPRLAQ